MAEIPEKYHDLLTTQKKAFAVLGTIMNNGTPQVTPIWFDWDGKDLIINTARGRVKDRNIQIHPDVALTILDPDDPYRYVEIRGKVIESNEETGWDVIDQLSHKYHGTDYPRYPGQVRVTYKIHPEHVHGSG